MYGLRGALVCAMGGPARGGWSCSPHREALRLLPLPGLPGLPRRARLLASRCGRWRRPWRLRQGQPDGPQAGLHRRRQGAQAVEGHLAACPRAQGRVGRHAAAVGVQHVRVAGLKGEGDQLVEAGLPVPVSQAPVEADAVQERQAGRVQRPQPRLLPLLLLPTSLLLRRRRQLQAVPAGVQAGGQKTKLALPVLGAVQLQEVRPLGDKNAQAGSVSMRRQ